MKIRSWLKLGAVLGLILAAAGLLRQLQAHQRLGQPGLRMSELPMRDPQGNPVGTNSVYLPERVLSYQGEIEPIARVVLDLLPKDTTYGQRRYRTEEGFWVSTSVVLMGSDRSSIHKPQICMVAQGWTITRTTPTHITIERPHRYELPIMKLDVTKEVLRPDGQRTQVNGVYIYWFVSQDQLTADHWDRQYWMARDLITRGLLQRWAYVSYFAACPPGLEQVTFERVKSLIEESVPSFQLVTGAPMRLAQASP